MNIIGRVKIKYEGRPVDCDLFEDGTVSLPDGSKRKLTKEQFEKISATLTSIAQTNVEEDYEFTGAQQVPPFQNVEITTEKKIEVKRILKIVFGIICALAIIGTAIFLVMKYKPEILGLAPNQYKVVTAAHDIQSGKAFSTEDISYVELTRDEYSALCTETYMNESGAMVADEPIFFLNAGNQIIGQYAAEDIKEGEIVKESLVTNHIYAGEISVNGDSQTVVSTDSDINGQVNIEIVAKITSEDGSVQEVTLSKMKLQGKSINEILDSSGNQIVVEQGNETNIGG